MKKFSYCQTEEIQPEKFNRRNSSGEILPSVFTAKRWHEIKLPKKPFTNRKKGITYLKGNKTEYYKR
jgi:hypothetical protein